jgi:hypothetical protein
LKTWNGMGIFFNTLQMYFFIRLYILHIFHTKGTQPTLSRSTPMQPLIILRCSDTSVNQPVDSRYTESMTNSEEFYHELQYEHIILSLLFKLLTDFLNHL